jgi:hypothetical protein
MIVIRDAEPYDFPHIERLREEYYARRNAPTQIRTDVSWTVAEADGRIVAAQATQDFEVEGQRFVTDTYADQDRFGVLGLKALDATLRDDARRDKVMLIGFTEPDNLKHMNAACKRGWRPVAVALAWDPTWEGH